MRVSSFDALLESLNKLDLWLESLGIEPKWHQAVQMVKKAKEQQQIVGRGWSPGANQ